MKEDLQINIAANLVDADAPERMSQMRAGEFVAKTLRKNTIYKMERKTIPFLVWGGALATVAASIVLGIFVFRPSASQNYGTPSQLMEMQSIHSNIATVDTTIVERADTILLYEIVEEK